MAEKKISGVFHRSICPQPFQRSSDTGLDSANMCWPATAPEPSWLYPAATNGILNSPGISIFPSPISSAMHFNGSEANPTKDAILENSDFLNGMVMRDAIDVVNAKIEEKGIGRRKVNYRMRDAAFSRQRYWGEPFPIKWIDGVAIPLDGDGTAAASFPKWKIISLAQMAKDPLPIFLNGRPCNLETNTMPGYAGSSWYFLKIHGSAERPRILQQGGVRLLEPGGPVYWRNRTCRRTSSLQQDVDQSCSTILDISGLTNLLKNWSTRE